MKSDNECAAGLFVFEIWMYTIFVFLFLDGLKTGTKIGFFSHFLRFSYPHLHVFSVFLRAGNWVATAIYRQGVLCTCMSVILAEREDPKAKREAIQASLRTGLITGLVCSLSWLMIQYNASIRRHVIRRRCSRCSKYSGRYTM